jgi:hypothetical protein
MATQPTGATIILTVSKAKGKEGSRKESRKESRIQTSNETGRVKISQLTTAQNKQPQYYMNNPQAQVRTNGGQKRKI